MTAVCKNTQIEIMFKPRQMKSEIWHSCYNVFWKILLKIMEMIQKHRGIFRTLPSRQWKNRIKGESVNIFPSFRISPLLATCSLHSNQLWIFYRIVLGKNFSYELDWLELHIMFFCINSSVKWSGLTHLHIEKKTFQKTKT